MCECEDRIDLTSLVFQNEQTTFDNFKKKGCRICALHLFTFILLEYNIILYVCVWCDVCDSILIPDSIVTHLIYNPTSCLLECRFVGFKLIMGIGMLYLLKGAKRIMH